MAEADLHGLGSKQSEAVLHNWNGSQLRLSPQILPWLSLLPLFLLKSNRKAQAWLVCVPLVAVAGIGWNLTNWVKISDEGFRLIAEALPTALAFGWTAMLLLAPSALRSRKLGQFAFLLVSLTVFSLLALATSQVWRGEMLMDVVCAVTLQFMIFGLASTLNLAGRSTGRQFRLARFLGWFALWSTVVWLALGIPMATLSLLGRSDALPGVLGVVGCCCGICFVVSLPFLALAAAVPIYRQRLGEAVVPEAPALSAGAPEFQGSERSTPALSR